MSALSDRRLTGDCWPDPLHGGAGQGQQAGQTVQAGRRVNKLVLSTIPQGRGNPAKNGRAFLKTPGCKLIGFVVVAISLLYSLPDITVSAQQETAEQFVERVKRAIKNDEWGRAKSGIRHALGLKPESAEANYVAAQVYWHEGARSMAIDALKRALQSQPVFPEARILLARCLLHSNKLDDARAEVHLAIGQGAQLFPAYRLLAEIEITKGDFHAATVALETFLQHAQVTAAAEEANTQDQIEELRLLVERLKKFADLEANQKSAAIIKPRLLEPAIPGYNDEARRLKIQGVVLLGIHVTENGNVDSVLALRGLGHGLDEGAEQAARKLKFAPATENGKAVPYWMKLNIEFVLK